MRPVRAGRRQAGRRHARTRVAGLLGAALVGPWLMGAMAASPTDQVELSGQTGQYVFTPVCSSRAMQVRHSEAQVRWTHRTQPDTALGATVVTHLDLYASRAIKQEQDNANGREELELWLMLRGQVGLDWSWFGFRLGLGGGGLWDDAENAERASDDTSTTTGTTKMDWQWVIPAVSLRVGPQRLHVRLAIADGTWQLRPTDLTLGVGIGDGGDDPEAPRDLRGYLGVGGDLRDSSSDPFFYAGARMNLVTINVGLQGRVGPDGWSGGLWLGLPL